MNTPTGPIVITFVAMFRAVVSLQLISADFMFNSALSRDAWQRAVNVNRPHQLLPQPWPPVDTGRADGLRIGALLKMKSLLSLPHANQIASSADIQERIARRYPSVHPEEQASDSTLFNAHVELDEKGAVTSGFTYPRTGQFPELDSPPDAEAGSIDYVTQMILFAITRELEISGF
jgi:hypothetical protein